MIENKIKWWLISDGDFKDIQITLLKKLSICKCIDIEDALYILESSLHETDAVPDDYDVIEELIK